MLTRTHRTIASVAIILIESLICSALGQGLQAPRASDTPAVLGDALSDFFQKHKLKTATITVRKDGELVYQIGFGGADPAQARDVASLSKAVTGACIGTLIRNGWFDLDTPLSKASPALVNNAKIQDQRIKDISIGQLLSHTSGLAGNNQDGEISTGEKLFELLNNKSNYTTSLKEMTKLSLSQNLKYNPGQFKYSNDNYLILGRVIEEQTKKPYEESCRERVIEPSKSKGHMSKDWRLMDSFGGWKFNGNDYLTFLERVSKDSDIVGEKIFQWRNTGQGYRYEDNNLSYGPGLLVRKFANNYNVFHWGSWRVNYNSKNININTSFNTYAAYIGFLNASYFVSFEPQLLEDKRIMLDKELWNAVNRVTKWQK